MSRAGSVSARVLCLMFNPYACTQQALSIDKYE